MLSKSLFCLTIFAACVSHADDWRHVSLNVDGGNAVIDFLTTSYSTQESGLQVTHLVADPAWLNLTVNSCTSADVMTVTIRSFDPQGEQLQTMKDLVLEPVKGKSCTYTLLLGQIELGWRKPGYHQTLTDDFEQHISFAKNGAELSIEGDPNTTVRMNRAQ